jgi:hypothetical protein
MPTIDRPESSRIASKVGKFSGPSQKKQKFSALFFFAPATRHFNKLRDRKTVYEKPHIFTKSQGRSKRCKFGRFYARNTLAEGLSPSSVEAPCNHPIETIQLA